MRIITVGGLTLLLIGLCKLPVCLNCKKPSRIKKEEERRIYCKERLTWRVYQTCLGCLAAVLLRFSQHGEYTIHRIEREKVQVLDQETINKSFPIRVYPSQQRIFLDKDDQPIASTTLIDHGSFTPKSSLDQSANKPTTARRQNSFQQRLQQDINSEDEKAPVQFPPQHSFMGLGLMGRLWSRDSSRCNSTCNSPCPTQVAQMPTFTTAMMQKTPRLPSSSFAIPITPEQVASETLAEPAAPLISEDLCSICLGEYVPDDRLRVLPCSHEYHAECIGKSLTHHLQSGFTLRIIVQE